MDGVYCNSDVSAGTAVTQSRWIGNVMNVRGR